MDLAEHHRKGVVEVVPLLTQIHVPLSHLYYKYFIQHNFNIYAYTFFSPNFQKSLTYDQCHRDLKWNFLSEQFGYF